MPGEQKQEEQAEASAEMSKEEFWSQLRAEILRQGQGEGAKNGDKLTVHYVGILEDGTKFDSSVDRGQPFTVTLGAGQVIQGWDLGLVGMKKGEIRRLYIPSQLGYGERGVGSIPPNANLIFEVELLEIGSD
jgi:peptidylprolyl isomerase